VKTKYSPATENRLYQIHMFHNSRKPNQIFYRAQSIIR